MSSDLNIDWQAVSQFGDNQNASMVPIGRDNEYTVTFYMGKVPNFDGTDYIEVPHIRLQAPGNTKAVYDQPVREDSFPNRPSDPERFPLQWAAFKRGENMFGTGTPLIDWEGVTPGDIRRLEIVGVTTIEQLAQVADAHLDGLGFGGRMIRERARQFVTGRTPHDPEKAQLKEQVGKLTDLVQTFLSRMDPAALAAMGLGDETPPAPAAEPPAKPARASRAQQEG